MNVLSLFNGMGCIWIALENLGVKVDKRYSSEIDKYANKVNDALYPDTIQLGSVTDVHAKDLEKIDLLTFGSPCQGFSFAGKGLNFQDPRSALFFEAVRILKEIREINPNVLFLMENVQMKHEHEVIISKYLGVNPIVINSALVSAQNRVRLYWTNIYNQPYGLFGDMECKIPQPKDKGILLKDVLEKEVDEKYFLKDSQLKWWNKNKEFQLAKGYSSLDAEKGITETARQYASWNGNFVSEAQCVAMRGRNPDNPKSRVAGLPTEQQLEPRDDGKTNCLTSVTKDNLVREVKQLNPSTESGGKQPYQQNRVYDANGLSPALCKNKADLLIQGADFRTDEGLRIRDGGKTGTLAARARNDESCGQLAVLGTKIRRLTPRECGRLQTVPEPKLDAMLSCGVSDSQLYKIFGNGWTIDVISHILSFANIS